MVPAAGTLGPVANNFGISLLVKNLFPNVEISGDMWIAVGFPPDAREQNYQVWRLAKYASRSVRLQPRAIGRRRRDVSGVEFGEVCLLRLADS